MQTIDTYPTWADLLARAVSEPGTISDAYTRFWPYSPANQLLALWQCAFRGIEPGPLNTFPGWIKLGRWVRKGERAIVLCMPVLFGRCTTTDEATGEETSHRGTARRFAYKPRWFTLNQTDGADYRPPAAPGWDAARALAQLSVTVEPFRLTDGNVQGYAHPDRRSIAVSPVAAHPLKTTVHELGHVLLHSEPSQDRADLPRSLQEAEAEATALLVLDSLGLPGAEQCRGYIQSWLSGQSIPEKSAQRIFASADRILRAGRDAAEEAPR